jgi:RNA polymerase sigma-70 factor (ECF subfamily)
LLTGRVDFSQRGSRRNKLKNPQDEALRVNIAIHPTFGGQTWSVESEAPVALESVSDAEIVRAVRAGDTEQFGVLVERHQTRLFALVRRYLRREDDVADLVQDVLVKAFSRLDSWRGEAPFEHWLMRLATRACLDALRSQRRHREDTLTDLSAEETEWLDRHAVSPERNDHRSEAARSLVRRIFEQLSPAHRMVLTLLELEDRSVKEISAITGWSQTLVKVRAFRARAEMKRVLGRLQTDAFL